MGGPIRLRRAIGEGPPLVLDAAMGTRLVELGLDLRTDDPALWNLTHPESVLSIHRRDREAGADILFTNTFGAGRQALARLGHSDATNSINRYAVSLARQAAGQDGYVIGSMGPSGHDDGGASTIEQATILLDAGVDGLILETHRMDQAERALRWLGRWVEVPLIVSLYVWPEPIGPCARKLIDLGASVLGVNCGIGPESSIETTERFFLSPSSPWLVKASAGVSGGEIAAPARFAEFTRRFRELGVRMIGGCCGTTDAHIAAIRTAVDRS